MGTRGLMGVRVDGVDKLTYNHFDSYPSALGEDVLTYIKTITNLDEEVDKARRLRLVQENDVPSSIDIETYKKHSNLKVGDRKINSWYCLLRNLQGKLPEILTAGVMIDSHEFINDSLFCEWVYIVNFDEMVLEVYKGFQEKPHNKGRYSGAVSDQEYYPCALISTFHINALPSNLDYLKEGIKE